MNFDKNNVNLSAILSEMGTIPSVMMPKVRLQVNVSKENTAVPLTFKSMPADLYPVVYRLADHLVAKPSSRVSQTS